MEVYATLLSRGIYLASIRTMYRLLAAQGETQERRNQRRTQVHAKPSLTATAPNQVWTWDITKLATTAVGVFLHAYVIIDLFSRYVVGWMVAARECKHLAAQLFAETIARHGVEPGLTVHADRGLRHEERHAGAVACDARGLSAASAARTCRTTTRSARHSSRP
jgi:putative transposase